MADEHPAGGEQPDNVSTMHTREEKSMDANGASTNGTTTENAEVMGSAAGVLRDAAHRMRERASQATVPGMDVAAQAAAKPLEQGADYIENRSPQDIWSDLMRFCRDHPAGALFIGFAVGYLFHKLFR
jgi:hypothetical protein